MNKNYLQKSEADYNMIDWWKKVHLQKYADFNGRARRAEYWYSYLANCIVFLTIYILLIIGIANENKILMATSGILLAVFFVFILIPYLAVAVRRLHDTNKSGWFLLLSIVPLVSIVVFIFTVLEGDKLPNKYGKNPKDYKNEDEINQIGQE